MAQQPSAASFGITRQMEIYQQGLMGNKPGTPVCFEDLQEHAKKKMKPAAFDYVAGSAGAENAMRGNHNAFLNWSIIPRYLRNVQQRDLSVEVLGHTLCAPVILAPIGVLGIVHPEAETAVAKAAASLNLPMVLSTVSSTPLEEVAKAMANATRWFQLYWPANNELAASLVQRAERAGFTALVVTLDTYLLAWRERDLQNAYLPFLQGDGLANYFTDPVFLALLGDDPRTSPVKAISLFGSLFSNPSLTWDMLDLLRSWTKMPILLKGVLHPDDARQALDYGVDGLIVSNHGGRQLDGAIASLDALPGVVAAVKDQATILLDSGIRRGADVFKAIALGARAVMVGRPYCYGLAINGEAGVREVLLNLIADFDLTLGLAGCSSVYQIHRDHLIARAR